MNLAFFVHSVVSDWNHGNAHFLRGLMSALVRRGHAVASYEARRSWSVENLLSEHGPGPIVEFARAFPEIEVRTYDPAGPGLREEVAAAAAWADALVVHEWNEPQLVAAAAAARRPGLALLFHDSHHRAWSDPEAIARLELAAYDGVLAFGESLRALYRCRLGARRAWTFHEAADVERFRPLEEPRRQEVVWIGNWGDGERSEELRSYLLGSARTLPDLRFAAYGVRYPADALAELAAARVEFRGWAASLAVPRIFAASAVTLHVPRRAYAEALPGIPTIRVFEALACGIPLVSTPWRDVEGLFRPGDYRVAETPAEMALALSLLARHEDARLEQAARGRETVLARHTCDHRAEELLAVLETLGREGADGAPRQEVAAAAGRAGSAGNPPLRSEPTCA